MSMGHSFHVKYSNSGIYQGQFFIFRWIIGSMLNFQNMKSIRGNYLNVLMGHRLHIK